MNEELEQLSKTEALKALKRKKQKRKIRKEIKDNSAYSLTKVITTALVAATVAIVSSKLTTVVNSILLVILVSIISATITEIYRVVAILLKYGAKTVAAPLIPETDKIKEQIDKDALLEEEIKFLETKFGIPPTEAMDLPAQIKAAEELLAANKQEVKEQTLVKTTAIEVVTEAVKGAPLKTPNNESQSVFRKIVDFVRIRPNLKLVLLFFAVGLVSVGASYAIASMNEPVVKETTIEKTIELSEKEKQALVNQAAKTAVDAAVAKAIEQNDVLQASTNDILLSITSLEAQIEALKNDPTLSNTTATLENKIAQLESTIESLKERIAKIEEKPTSTPLMIPTS